MGERSPVPRIFFSLTGQDAKVQKISFCKQKTTSILSRLEKTKSLRTSGLCDFYLFIVAGKLSRLAGVSDPAPY
jgi:hypothetical protein